MKKNDSFKNSSESDNPSEITQELNELTNMIKRISYWTLSNNENRKKIFEVSEKYGIHITPVHFYQAIPDTREITLDMFGENLIVNRIPFKEKNQLDLIKKLSKYSKELEKIPENSTGDDKQYYFKNNLFGPTDAAIYYSIIREYKPSKIMEVGSGLSTLIASHASLKNQNTSIIAIEPYPKKFLKSGLPNLSELIQEPVQNIPIKKFQELGKNDILFIDCSHVSKINSDVNHLYLRILPELNSGVLVHIHDFFLPYEYPKKWIFDLKRFWNEQYLVGAFLIGNSEYEILISNHLLERNNKNAIESSFPILKGRVYGGSLWIRKK